MDYLKLKCDCESRDEESKNRIFDTVLNLNIMKPEDGSKDLLGDYSA